MHAGDNVLYIFRRGKGLQRIPGPRDESRRNHDATEAVIALEGVAQLDHFILIRNTLVGTCNGSIVLFELGTSHAYLQKAGHLQKYLQVKHIAFDPYFRSLYIADEAAGLLKADMASGASPGEASAFMPDTFDVFKGRIAGLKFFGTYLFLLVAGEGVCAVHCGGNEEGAVKMYRSKDPRDVLYVPEEGVLVVADAVDGLLTFAEGDPVAFQQRAIPETDSAHLEIARFSSQVAIVRINDGLYLYHFVRQQLDRVSYACTMFTVDAERGYLYHMRFDELTVRTWFGDPAFFGLPEKGKYDPDDRRMPLYWADDIRKWKSDDYFNYGDDHD